MEVGIVILILAALIVAGYASAKFVYSLTEENTKTTDLKVSDKNKLIKVNKDFSSKMEGTLSGWTDEKYYKEPIDETIVLFSSEKIPGLSVVYYPTENRLVAGSPPIIVNNIHLFNGYKHHIGYAFKDDKQGLFYDGKLIAAADFLPRLQNGFTGMVTGSYSSEVSPSIRIETDSKESSQFGLTGFFE